MKRKNFLKKGVIGITAIITGGAIAATAGKRNEDADVTADDCDLSLRETKGPFSTHTPDKLVQSDIRSDRKGATLIINLTILDKTNNCNPLAGAVLDVWHCDKDGNYSEYGSTRIQRNDFSGEHFLRGRQTTGTDGKVSFHSIYPGWYQGRAPHIHLEIFDRQGKSLLVTQLAFPEDISGKVYSSALYADRGNAGTSNNNDNVFHDSLDELMASVSGNMNDGFTLTKTIVVKS